MEKYETLELQVISFEVDDVLTMQGTTGGGSGYYSATHAGN